MARPARRRGRLVARRAARHDLRGRPHHRQERIEIARQPEPAGDADSAEHGTLLAAGLAVDRGHRPARHRARRWPRRRPGRQRVGQGQPAGRGGTARHSVEARGRAQRRHAGRPRRDDRLRAGQQHPQPSTCARPNLRAASSPACCRCPARLPSTSMSRARGRRPTGAARAPSPSTARSSRPCRAGTSSPTGAASSRRRATASSHASCRRNSRRCSRARALSTSPALITSAGGAEVERATIESSALSASASGSLDPAGRQRLFAQPSRPRAAACRCRSAPSESPIDISVASASVRVLGDGARAGARHHRRLAIGRHQCHEADQPRPDAAFGRLRPDDPHRAVRRHGQRRRA